MDKYPAFPGSIPLTGNWESPQRATEIALGFIMQAAFGTNTVIDGLAVVPTSPASMKVDVGPGSIIFATTVDTLTSGFGSIPLDNADGLVKIGVNLTKTTMATLTAPGTAGQSQNWLVEAQFIEADGTPVVLPYYNAANPAVPYTGPANAGTTNNTARTNRVQLQWKGGTAAATGAQNTPTPDAGWVGVAIVTVTNGQSTITAANITPYSAAPTVPTKLALMRTKLFANLNMYVSATGSDTAGSGLSASSPFATLQKAWAYIMNNLDLNGFQVTVNVSAGTYTSGLIATGAPVGSVGTGSVVFSGTSATVSVSNATAFQASNGANLTVQGFTVAATGSSPNGCGISAATGAFVLVGPSMIFGNCATAHVLANGIGSIQITSNYSITGPSAAHLSSATNSVISVLPGITVTLTGTPAFSINFALAQGQSIINASGITFSGSATGSRYNALINSSITTGTGASATYFPGNLSGATSTGGQYT